MGPASLALLFVLLSSVCGLVTLICLPRVNRNLYVRLGKPPSWFDPQAVVLLHLLRPAYFRELHAGLRVLVIVYALGFLVAVSFLLVLLLSVSRV